MLKGQCLQMTTVDCHLFVRISMYSIYISNGVLRARRVNTTHASIHDKHNKHQKCIQRHQLQGTSVVLRVEKATSTAYQRVFQTQARTDRQHKDTNGVLRIGTRRHWPIRLVLEGNKKGKRYSDCDQFHQHRDKARVLREEEDDIT